MGKPRLIILCRHAQSVGNANRTIHQTVPDHRVPLTEHGHAQAVAAGDKLAALLLPTDTLQIITSPYTRTRETTLGILSSSLQHHPNAATIRVYEEPRLREQDFGNFQPCQTEMTRVWHERYAYGHFFYRIPNGESAADAYDRVSGFNESLWRQFADADFPSVLVLVTHGLMTRIFLMKWYHYSVEYFEDLRNVDHCEFVVMHKNAVSGKYDLQTELRTWSGYTHRHEELRYRCPPLAPYSAATPTPTRNGHDPQDSDGPHDPPDPDGHGHDSDHDPNHDPHHIPNYDPNYNPRKPRRPAWGEKQYGGCANGCTHDWDGVQGVASQYVMKGGRDFGGSRSGAASRAPSESSDGHRSDPDHDPDPDPDHDGSNSKKENKKKEKEKGGHGQQLGAADVEGVIRDLGRMAVGGGCVGPRKRNRNSRGHGHSGCSEDGDGLDAAAVNGRAGKEPGGGGGGHAEDVMERLKQDAVMAHVRATTG